MRDDELKDLLVKLSPADLGQLPIEIAGYNEPEEVSEDDMAHLFGKKLEEKEDPIQAAIKKDPLFGSW